MARNVEHLMTTSPAMEDDAESIEEEAIETNIRKGPQMVENDMVLKTLETAGCVGRQLREPTIENGNPKGPGVAVDDESLKTLFFYD
jgi:hypothetical protein